MASGSGIEKETEVLQHSMTTAGTRGLSKGTFLNPMWLTHEPFRPNAMLAGFFLPLNVTVTAPGKKLPDVPSNRLPL